MCSPAAHPELPIWGLPPCPSQVVPEGLCIPSWGQLTSRNCFSKGDPNHKISHATVAELGRICWAPRSPPRPSAPLQPACRGPREASSLGPPGSFWNLPPCFLGCFVMWERHCGLDALLQPLNIYTSRLPGAHLCTAGGTRRGSQPRADTLRRDWAPRGEPRRQVPWKAGGWGLGPAVCWESQDAFP